MLKTSRQDGLLFGPPTPSIWWPYKREGNGIKREGSYNIDPHNIFGTSLKLDEDISWLLVSGGCHMVNKFVMTHPVKQVYVILVAMAPPGRPWLLWSSNKEKRTKMWGKGYGDGGSTKNSPTLHWKEGAYADAKMGLSVSIWNIKK